MLVDGDSGQTNTTSTIVPVHLVALVRLIPYRLIQCQYEPDCNDNAGRNSPRLTAWIPAALTNATRYLGIDPIKQVIPRDVSSAPLAARIRPRETRKSNQSMCPTRPVIQSSFVLSLPLICLMSGTRLPSEGCDICVVGRQLFPLHVFGLALLPLCIG